LGQSSMHRMPLLCFSRMHHVSFALLVFSCFPSLCAS
jgi:hypothetical protein